jgi:hypothetical protein
MTKKDILAEVARAEAELELMDITTVAEKLGQKPQNLRMRAINHGIGTVVGKVGRVYSPSDVEALRELIEGGHRPATMDLKNKMLRLRLDGLNNRQIAAKLGVDPSRVTQLLK